MADQSDNPQSHQSRVSPTPSADRLKRQFRLADSESADKGKQDPYRRLGRDARERSVNRHDVRLARVSNLERKLLWRGRLIALACLLLLAGVLSGMYWRHAPDSYEPPENLATWIAQQRFLEQLRKIQEWVEQGSASTPEQTPKTLEELQAWIDQLKLNPELQSASRPSGSGEPGFVPFQCATAPITCEEGDVPAADGEYRYELSRLVRNANIMLADTGDCEGTVNLIGEYDSLFGWRRSESATKARTELSVARCFMDKEDHDNAALHYRRTFCASVSNPDPDQAMNALYGLARISYREQDMATVESRITCSESLLDYHLGSTTTVETLHHFISLALMHYEFLNDSHEAIRLQERALDHGRALMVTAESEDQHSFYNLLVTLQLNLMEGYITVNESDKLFELHDEVIRNPLLRDSDYLIARGMLVMQALIDGSDDIAASSLREILSRYRSLSEFETFWSWDAFDRWQQETRNQRSDVVDGQIARLRQALSPPVSGQALLLLQTLLQEVSG